MFNGSSKIINIQGSPSGAKVTSNPDIGSYTVPASLSLSRKHSYVLTFSKEGYKESKVQIRAGAQFGIIVLDILMTGLIGVVVDAATGSWNNLTPDQVSVNLEKAEVGTLGPDKVEIQLSMKNQNAAKIDISSSAPVVVRVQETK
jgi:hypothetical protein